MRTSDSSSEVEGCGQVGVNGGGKMETGVRWKDVD